MDRELWHLGELESKRRQHANPWELDFLRGMHQGPALVTLARHLSASTRSVVRLSSIWLDKHAWASWQDEQGKTIGRRELADLAVIIRRDGKVGLDSWMWLLQGKRTDKLLQSYSGSSSDFELDLLQRMPKFRLQGVTAAFDLESEFKAGVEKLPDKGMSWTAPISVPWCFLDFDKDLAAPESAYRKGFSPISARWLGEAPVPGSWADTWQKSANYPTSSISSYTGCLISIIEGHTRDWSDPVGRGANKPALTPGAPVYDSKFPEWTRLYEELFLNASISKSGHAKTASNSDGSVLQFCNDFQPHIAQELIEEEIWPHANYLWSRDLRFTVAYSSVGAPSDFGKLIEFDRKVSKSVETKTPNNGGGSPLNTIFENESPGLQVLVIDVIGEQGRNG